MRLQILDPETNFSCGSCTKCCDQPWGTLIEHDKAHALDAHDFGAHAQLADKKFYDADKETPEGYYVLAKGEGTRCLFLDTDGLCIIHKEMGPAAKPYPCLKFPYTVTQTQTDDRVSVDYGCPAVQSQQGPKLSEQLDDIRAVVEQDDIAESSDARVKLDPQCDLSLEEAGALYDRLWAIFEAGYMPDMWSRFSASLSLLVGVRRYKQRVTTEGTDATLIELLRTGAQLPDMPDVTDITAYSKPSDASSPARLLFASTVFRDTVPASSSFSMSFWKRLTMFPKLMTLARLNGAYPSRLLGRMIDINEVLAHEVKPELDAAADDLLLRYMRSRIWQRTLMGTRLSIIAGMHQHIHDFGAVIFFARAEAQHCGKDRLDESLIRLGLNRVEFHLASQQRLFDQNLIGWFTNQLQSPTVALQSLRLMSLVPAPVESVTEQE
ncbi:MAG: YkgJ family cysteine cluster protein [Planctomycetes bacterium]|nr:YkgJ family cysteine cluster protein [Planctomycetota bacterium]